MASRIRPTCSRSRFRTRVLCALCPLLTVLLLIISPSWADQKPRVPDDFASLAAEADAARDAERLDDAVRLYRKGLSLRSKWAEGWWSLATIEYDRNRYAEAVRAFRKVTALAPNNGTAYVMLGLSEFELGDDGVSLQHLRKGRKIGFANDALLRKVALYHEGILEQRAGKFEAAQETLEQLCLQGGQSDEVASVLGMTLLRSTAKELPAQGSPEAGIALRIGRAECLVGQQKYDEARPGFESVVKENPNYPNIHYAYGLFLLELHDLVGGVEQLKEEIKNNPNHLYARLRIAAAEYKTDSAAGLPFAEEAVKLRPDLPFGHYLLGLLLLDVDQAARAIPELELAQKTFTRDPKLYFALGSAYSSEGRKQDAARARAMFERLNKEAENEKSLDQQEAGGPDHQRIGPPADPPQW